MRLDIRQSCAVFERPQVGDCCRVIFHRAASATTGHLSKTGLSETHPSRRFGLVNDVASSAGAADPVYIRMKSNARAAQTGGKTTVRFASHYGEPDID
jgi:hypothetical protein